jgi:hypothetical protein
MDDICSGVIHIHINQFTLFMVLTPRNNRLHMKYPLRMKQLQTFIALRFPINDVSSGETEKTE